MQPIVQESMPNVENILVNKPLVDESGSTLSLALKLILFTVFLPQELSFFVAGLRLTSTRLIFIVLTPMVFARLGKKMATGHYRFVASDLFIPMAALWMFIGPTAIYGFNDTVVHSGPIVLEYVTAYMSTRVLLSGKSEALRFIDLLCLITSFVVIDGILDTMTGRFFTRELLGQYLGYGNFLKNEDMYRFGLVRATGPIEHPILFGFTSAIGLLLAIAIKIRWRTFCIAACALGLVIAFSSAPQQCAIMGFGLLIYSQVFPSLPHKWLLLSIVPVVTAVSLFLSTNTPFGHLFELITIDPSTAYYRLYIWQSVGPAILQNPFFAVSDSAYDYQGSIDSVWLVLSLAYGMPCSILAALSMIGSCSIPTNGPRARLSNAEERLGTAMGIIIFLIIFMGFTVHFWGSIWILVGLLIGVRAHLGELGRLNQAEEFQGSSAVPRVESGYTLST